jgi:hypothetical protein
MKHPAHPEPTMTTAATKTVRIETAATGQNFGCFGRIKALNGRTIWTGKTRPTGCERAALADCEDRAVAMGWTVANPL